MAEKKTDAKTKVKEVSDGLSILKTLATPKDKAKTDPKTPPPPPPVRTDSISGLLTSLKDRASYAVFGPPKSTTPPK